MSTEESLDPQLIEQTRQQIRSLVGEIAQLSKGHVAPEEFYGEFLPRVVSALAAVGGAVWTTNDEGRLALQYQVNIQQTRLRENEEGQAQHGRLLYKCLSGGEGMLVPPHSGAGEGDEGQGGNPTDFLLVLGPLKTDLEVVGVLEIFQRSEAGPNTQKGYLRFLVQMCELAGDFLKSHQLRHFSDRQVLWTQLEDFTHLVHSCLDPRETAYTVANEGRRLIECDRVSVAICKGNKCRIEAVSGQDLFDKRSNMVRLLGQLATAVVRTGDPVWYAGDTRDMAPQVEDAIQEYVDESHSKNVAVLPLKRPQLDEEDDPHKRAEPEPPVGALIVEQIEDSRVPQSMVQRVEVVCRHSSTALANALEHRSLFLMPLWRFLGKTKWVLRARTLPKTLTVAGIILAALLWLFFWPADFQARSKGTLEPVDRREVFAHVQGTVSEVHVEHRDLVYTGEIKQQALAAVGKLYQGESRRIDEQFLGELFDTLVGTGIYEQTAKETITKLRDRYGERVVPKAGVLKIDVLKIVEGNVKTLLVTLRSPQLNIAVNDVRGKHKATRKQIEDIRHKILRAVGAEEDRLRGQLGVLQVQLESLNKQLQLYEEWRKDLKVNSPIKGQVVTFEPYKLVGRSVQPGHRLIEIADPDGPWRLELHMPENRIGHIAAAQRDRYQDLRKRLRQVLRNKRGGEPDEELDKEVDQEVDQVPDRQLSGKLRQLLGEQLKEDLNQKLAKVLEKVPDDQSQPLSEQIPNQQLRNRLDAAIGEPSYENSRSTLSRLVDKLPLGEFRTGVRDLLDDGLDDRLPVTYILATDPNAKFQGRIEEIDLSAEVRGEGGNTVLIKVEIDEDELPDRWSGAAATGKVYCGRRSIGYVWFHDLIAFIQSRILFRFF